MHRNSKLLAQFAGKVAGFLGFLAGVAAHVQRKADDYFFDLVFGNQPAELAQIATLVLALQGRDALGSDAERVGDGKADAFGAHVQGQNASRAGHLNDYRARPS